MKKKFQKIFWYPTWGAFFGGRCQVKFTKINILAVQHIKSGYYRHQESQFDLYFHENPFLDHPESFWVFFGPLLDKILKKIQKPSEVSIPSKIDM